MLPCGKPIRWILSILSFPVFCSVNCVSELRALRGYGLEGLREGCFFRKAGVMTSQPIHRARNGRSFDRINKINGMKCCLRETHSVDFVHSVLSRFCSVNSVSELCALRGNGPEGLREGLFLWS